MSKYRLITKFRYGKNDTWYEIHRRFPIVGWVRIKKFEGQHARHRSLDYWNSILVDGRIEKTIVEGEV